MKKIVIVLSVIVCIVLGLGITLAVMEKNKKATMTAGVWWWNDQLDVETYMNFAKDNKINEIYFCTSNFDSDTENFIKDANSRKINVYWLAGEYEWLDDNSKLFEQIGDYINYQKKYTHAQFSGIHLDIEPHQNPNFETKREQLIYNLIDLANTLKVTYPDIKFDYDLPFWLHDEITYNNQTKLAYEFMIDIANRVFVMSYRDTAKDIVNVAKEEISYAIEKNKQLVLCVETFSTEGDKVSFFEEGKDIMNTEINEVKKQIPNNFGIAIHQIKTWYELKK